MCGIAGIVNLKGPEPIEPAMLERMAQALYHRGPDEDGFFLRPGSAWHRAGSASSAWPMAGSRSTTKTATSPSSSTASFSTIPNARPTFCRAAISSAPIAIPSLLPHLWEDHGEAMLEKLRGQFAIALWDHRQQQLILARDRFGICPLFWTRQTTPAGDFLLFASEIKALLASGLVQARPDPRGIHHVFTFFASPGPVTCFQDVQILLPGRYLTIQPGWHGDSARIQEKVYWEIDFPDQGQEENRDFNRWGSNRRPRRWTTSRRFCEQAVARRLRADVPVVSYLSGGVDSSVVVALASKLRRQEGKGAIPTFTISIQDRHLNERNEATAMARRRRAGPWPALHSFR